jgi:hypothetical protein
MADPRGAFIGSGKLYVAPYETPGKLEFVGNVSSLEYQPETNDIELTDYTTPGGGLDASIRRITAVNISFEARHLTVANLKRALFGTSTDTAAGSVLAEAHTAYPGALVTLKHSGATDHVVKTTGAGAATLVLDTDYAVTAAGSIQILEGGAISAETAIEVDYDYKAQSTIEAMTATGQRFRVYFEGQNEVDGRITTIDAYKVGFSPANLSMIGDDFASLPFEGKCEKDDTKTATGISQFLKVDSVD